MACNKYVNDVLNHQSSLFHCDDYARVQEEYFREIIEEQNWYALPAGWLNPKALSAEYFKIEIPSRLHLQNYIVDDGRSLESEKEPLLRLISEWEAKPTDYDQVTLCSSVSTANLAVLFALKRRRVQNLVFDTPAYFATLEQARHLGFNLVKIPTYRQNNFMIDIDLIRHLKQNLPQFCLVLTQPKFGLGCNNDIKYLQCLVDAVGEQNFVLIDEAAEQLFPSLTSALIGPIIRTRSMFKGLGLNGLRLTFIIHPKEWRSDLEHGIDLAAGTIDRFSLMNAVSLSKQPRLFASLLKFAHSQVLVGRQEAEISCTGSWATPSNLENGYMGSVFLDIARLNGDQDSARNAFLSYCRRRRTPVITGRSVGFAIDDSFEAVRINYFTSAENLRRSVEVLVSAFDEVKAYLKSGFQ